MTTTDTHASSNSVPMSTAPMSTVQPRSTDAAPPRASSRPPTGRRPLWTQALPLMWKVPFVSERLAARCFVTPFGKLRDEERVLPKTERRVESVRAPGRVEVHCYGTGAPVFLVHGWGGQALQMSAFVDELVGRGHQVIAIDLPSHGASEGKRTNVVEAAKALLAVERRYGSPVGVVAHSFGAAAVTLAVRRGLQLSAAVFIAPLPSLELGIRQFAQRAGVPLKVLDRASRLIEARAEVDRREISLAQVGASLGVPSLIVHDADDHIIDVRHSREILEAWPEARLVVTEGLGHRRILRDRGVIERAAAFLQPQVGERRSELQGRLACAAS